MTGAHDDVSTEDGPVAPDLVQYLIVVVPDVAAIDSVVAALDDMVATTTIRVLDVVVVSHAADGTITASELDGITSSPPLNISAAPSGMLSQHDVELAAFEVPRGTSGLVVVIEDTWAEPLSLAASRVGGRIVAGERIPASRVEAVLADAVERPGDAP